MDDINYREAVKKLYPNSWIGASGNLWCNHGTIDGTLGKSWEEAYYKLYGRQLELNITPGPG